MGIVIVKREKYIIRNLFLIWNVFVDGKKIVRLPDERTISFELNEGSHEIQIGGGTPFYPFARKWVRSNKVIFTIGKDEMLHFVTNYHPFWNLTYRRPDVLHPSESLMLLPIDNKYNDTFVQSCMNELSHKQEDISNGYRRSRNDLVLHSVFMLLFICLPIFFRSSFSGLVDWFGFCFVAGLVTLVIEPKAHVISGRDAFLSFTILLGYKNAYSNPLIAIGALLAGLLLGLRYLRQYKNFKSLNEELKKSDILLGTINLS